MLFAFLLSTKSFVLFASPSAIFLHLLKDFHLFPLLSQSSFWLFRKIFWQKSSFIFIHGYSRRSQDIFVRQNKTFLLEAWFYEREKGLKSFERFQTFVLVTLYIQKKIQTFQSLLLFLFLTHIHHNSICFIKYISSSRIDELQFIWSM